MLTATAAFDSKTVAAIVNELPVEEIVYKASQRLLSLLGMLETAAALAKSAPAYYTRQRCKAEIPSLLDDIAEVTAFLNTVRG